MSRIRNRFIFFLPVSFLMISTMLYHINYSINNNSLKLEAKTEVSTLLRDSNRKIYVFISSGFDVLKLSPVILECHRQHIPVVTVFTGHDVDSIRPYLNIFKISVDARFSEPLDKNQPIVSTISQIWAQTIFLHFSSKDIWIIQGEGNDVLALATFAFQNKIRFAYIVPWFHEELVWTRIARLASYNFVPSALVAENLVREGTDKQKIYFGGNTVFDSVHYLKSHNMVRSPLALLGKVQKFLILVIFEDAKTMIKNFNIISGHVCSDCRFIVPISKDSISTNSIRRFCSRDPRFLCTVYLSFVNLHWLFKNSDLILTDSFGRLEEMAPYNAKTLVIKRKGKGEEHLPLENVQVVTDLNTISETIDKILSDQKGKTTSGKELMISNNAGLNIVNILKTHLHDKVDGTLELLQMNDGRFRINVKSICSSLQSSKNISIAVILQVFKRNNTLEKLLDCAVRQTLVPKTIVIFQNGYAFDISKTIQAFRKKYPNIEFQHIASSKNLRFHGRFHLAYLQTEDYVSVWDDDVSVDTEWLAYAVQYSLGHNCSLIGANCRNFLTITKDRVTQDMNSKGLCDFVGHVWTLPRRYLIFYLEMPTFTYYTGEDIQLSYALQKHGIASYNPPMSKHKTVRDMRQGTDKYSSWKTNQSPRHLLFCKIISKGFVTLKCSNCYNRTTVDQCIALNSVKATEAEMQVIEKDRKENVYSWS